MAAIVLDDMLYNGIVKYFNTLKAVGFIAKEEEYRLIICRFLINYMKSVIVGQEDVDKIYHIYECLSDGCVFESYPLCISVNDTDNDRFTYILSLILK